MVPRRDVAHREPAGGCAAAARAPLSPASLRWRWPILMGVAPCCLVWQWLPSGPLPTAVARMGAGRAASKAEKKKKKRAQRGGVVSVGRASRPPTKARNGPAQAIVITVRVPQRARSWHPREEDGIDEKTPVE